MPFSPSPLLFFFPQSDASCCSDLDYKLSKVLLHCYFRQSYPLEKYNRDLTACWFYSPVIKGQTAQKEAYHWMPCHVFQYYKMILALIFHPLCSQLLQRKRKILSLSARKKEKAFSLPKQRDLKIHCAGF